MVSVDLYEHAKGENASYYLIFDDNAGIHIGDARKKYTKSDATKTEQLTEIHNWRRSLSAMFNANYDAPTPAILQLFSSKKIEDIIVGGERANIHAIEEISFVRTIVEALAEIDPSITTKAPQQITRIGDHAASKEIMDVIRKAHKYFSGQHAA